MGNFQFKALGIPGLTLVECRAFEDNRGGFMETWQAEEFTKAGLPAFVQENQSISAKGVVRGLHFQRKHPQGKLVRAVLGEVFDVAVDLRQDSPAFGRWRGVILSGANRRQLYIPPGCAHGFMALSEKAVFAYKCTDYYHPEEEEGILWNDPDLAIAWPDHGTVVLSDRDRVRPAWREYLRREGERKKKEGKIGQFAGGHRPQD